MDSAHALRECCSVHIPCAKAGKHLHPIRSFLQLLRRVVKHANVSILNINSPAASDQQGIPTEEMAVATAVDLMLRGVARHCPHLNWQGAKAQALSTPQLGCIVDSWSLRHEQATTRAASRLSSAGDVIGMEVGFQAEAQAEPQLLPQRQVALQLLQHRIHLGRLRWK